MRVCDTSSVGPPDEPSSVIETTAARGAQRTATAESSKLIGSPVCSAQLNPALRSQHQQ